MSPPGLSTTCLNASQSADTLFRSAVTRRRLIGLATAYWYDISLVGKEFDWSLRWEMSFQERRSHKVSY